MIARRHPPDTELIVDVAKMAIQQNYCAFVFYTLNYIVDPTPVKNYKKCVCVYFNRFTIVLCNCISRPEGRVRTQIYRRRICV